MRKLALCRVVAIAAAVLVWLAPASFAAVGQGKKAVRANAGRNTVFTQDYTYQARQYDNKTTCRVLALDRARRLLLQKVAAYLKNNAEVKTLQLTEEQIADVAAGIAGVEITNEKWDGKGYALTARSALNPREVMKSIGLLRQDPQRMQALEQTGKRADEALKAVEAARKELDAPDAEEGARDRYTDRVNKLSVTDLLGRGFALLAPGKDRDAAELFAKAIELDPESAPAYFGRGLAYFRMGDLRQAIVDIDQAVQMDPNEGESYGLRADLYAKLGHYEQAIEDYNQALEFNPKDARICGVLGELYAMAGNYRRAIDNYDRAIGIDPNNGTTYLNRGAAYHEIGYYREEIRDYNRAIQLNVKDATVYIGLGAAYYKLGDEKEAIKDFDKAIELSPKDGTAYFVRGTVYLNLKESQQGMRDLKTSAKLGCKEAQDYLQSQGIGW